MQIYVIPGGALTSERLLSCLGERKAMIERVTNEWRRLNLDLVLCPVFPYPAIPHNAPGRQQGCIRKTFNYSVDLIFLIEIFAELTSHFFHSCLHIHNDVESVRLPLRNDTIRKGIRREN